LFQQILKKVDVMAGRNYVFTSESVTEGHPDKICDQVSDAILDAILAKDPEARVACETAVSTGLVLVMGEFSTDCYVDIPHLVRDVIRDIGYDRAKYGFDADTCAVLTSIEEQSPDIAQGVNSALEHRRGDEDFHSSIGAGDQGLQLLDYPGITVQNLDPRLLPKLGVEEKDGQLVVPVVNTIPARFMGSGLGSPSAASGDYDITTSDKEEIAALGIDQLKFGDIVALEDCDNRFGRSYRRGALTVGVVVHSDCFVAGHGPGVTTLFTAIDGSLAVTEDSEANIGRILGVGRYR
jgi:hypothetical protein